MVDDDFLDLGSGARVLRGDVPTALQRRYDAACDRMRRDQSITAKAAWLGVVDEIRRVCSELTTKLRRADDLRKRAPPGDDCELAVRCGYMAPADQISADRQCSVRERAGSDVIPISRLSGWGQFQLRRLVGQFERATHPSDRVAIRREIQDLLGDPRL